jgi:hypothetical protein
LGTSTRVRLHNSRDPKKVACFSITFQLSRLVLRLALAVDRHLQGSLLTLLRVIDRALDTMVRPRRAADMR